MKNTIIAFTINKLVFASLFLLLFANSCTTLSPSDDDLIEDEIFESAQRGGCLSVTHLGRTEEDCCLVKLCSREKPSKHDNWYLDGFPQQPSNKAMNCWEIEVCETTTITFVKAHNYAWGDWETCEVVVECEPTQPIDCCETLCFDFETTQIGETGCHTVEVALNSTNPDCLFSNLFLKDIGLKISSGTGELTYMNTIENISSFSYCLGEGEIHDAEGQIILNGCFNRDGCEFNFSFDLFGSGPFEGQCGDD